MSTESRLRAGLRRLRERRAARRRRWIEKQHAKKPGEMYTDYWKGGGIGSGGPGSGGVG